MQTFLPYPDFKQSLEYLDDKRLCKQRVESSQIIKALTVPEYGWKNHPAVKMWNGYLESLVLYYNTSLEVWTARGFCNRKLIALKRNGFCLVPWWFGNKDFHESHRQALKAKWEGGYYRYVWPDNERKVLVPGKPQFIWKG